MSEFTGAAPRRSPIAAILDCGFALLVCVSLASAAPRAQVSAAPLQAALEAIELDGRRRDLSLIASDEFAGRDTPSPGLERTASLLAEALRTTGFAPGAEQGYFHEYPLWHSALDLEGTYVELVAGDQRLRLALGEDYFLRASSVWSNSLQRAAVVFVGAGSAAEFAQVDVQGSWALVFDSTGRSDKKVTLRAQRAGALGVLISYSESFEGREYSERFAVRTRNLKRGTLRYPRGDEPPSPRAGGICVYLTRASAAQLIALARPADLAAEIAWPTEVGTRLAIDVTDARRLAAEGARVEVKNVCGFWRGSDPELSKEVILLSAHYDHVGARGEVIYNGADDNGSGTCSLLALTRALARYGPMRRSVLVIWISGEEKGLWGSKAWSEDPWLPEGCRAVANINIDMVGRNDPHELQMTPSKEHASYNGLSRLAEALGPIEGFPTLGNGDEFYHRSDQANFAKLGIPVAFLHTGEHPDYHKPTDTANKIDYDKMRRVTRLILRVVDALQTDSLVF